MTEADFIKKYRAIIESLADIMEEHDTEDNLDIDLNSDILTISCESGTYVINKQSSIQEIWLSSPISGPHHFVSNEGVWKSNNGIEFFSLLSEEFGYSIIV